MLILVGEHNIKTKNPHSFAIRKTTLEWIGLISLLIFSFYNSITLLIFLLALLLLLQQREVGAIKILNLITLRTIINPGIAVDISQWQGVKWVILFFCSFYLLKSYYKLEENQRKKIRKITFFVILFMIYNVISALIFSSLPIIAIFKLLSYVVIFLGVLVGLSYTRNKIDWINWTYKMFAIIIILSLPLVFMPVGYLRNGHAFQGLTNQPNMFGIVGALFIGILLTSLQTERIKNKMFVFTAMTSISMYLIFISYSRTAFITSIVLLIVYIIFANINKVIKLVFINLFGAVLITFIVLEKSIINYITEFIYKGQSSLIFSRVDQVEGLLSNFMRNPLFGSGFAVPVLPYRNFAFSTEYVVEPGNLIMAVLSYSGIIGFILFALYIMRIIFANIKYFGVVCFLPIAAILISMGEMVFFSSNNVGIWCYMYLGIYLVYDKKLCFISIK